VDYDKMLLDQFKPGETGCAALVAKDGQVIYSRPSGCEPRTECPDATGYGFPDRVNHKQFTAMAILQLMEQASSPSRTR
jgi:hypothetical protein